MSDERLLPCPFCGGEAKVAHEYTEAWKLEYVMCFRCGCSTPPAISEDTVIQIWNTRKPMERIEERLEERADCLLKDFVLANKAIEVKQKSMCRIEELRGAIDIVKAGGVDETD